jgi:Fic family protein
MNEALSRILAKKKRLDKFRPFKPALIKNLDDWLRIELTYNSNAIEGNTLSRMETKLIVEDGITSSGKSVVEHQEAINHAKAFDYVVSLISQKQKIGFEKVILNIHSLILNKINDAYAGRFRDVPVRIQGSAAILPNFMKVPEEMDMFVKQLERKSNLSIPEVACLAHYELVRIHPFIDGNGRCARLLMNYILLKNNFAPALIKKEERKTYLSAVEEYNVFGRPEKYDSYMFKTIERGLDEYLKILQSPVSSAQTKLLKIGELATRSFVSVPTIRHWTTLGLLSVEDYTKGGYQLYSSNMIDRVKEIKKLQNEGLSLEKIMLKRAKFGHVIPK